jgi:hypothetical protein
MEEDLQLETVSNQGMFVCPASTMKNRRGTQCKGPKRKRVCAFTSVYDTGNPATQMNSTVQKRPQSNWLSGLFHMGVNPIVALAMAIVKTVDGYTVGL